MTAKPNGAVGWRRIKNENANKLGIVKNLVSTKKRVAVRLLTGRGVPGASKAYEYDVCTKVRAESVLLKRTLALQ